MRDPNNLLDVDINEEESETLVITDLAECDFPYNLMDEKDVKKYFKDIETDVRTSFEYHKYIGFLKENFDMTKCSIYENISNEDSTKIKIHIHHEPITLYDIVSTIFNKRSFFKEDISVHQVAKEAMYVHYKLMVGLIPLSVTVHELVHQQYLFIPTSKVFGNYKEFINQYKDFLPEGLEDKLAKIEEATLNGCEDFRLLDKHYIYLDTNQIQEHPNLEHVETMLNNRIEDIKNDIKGPIEVISRIKD